MISNSIICEFEVTSPASPLVDINVEEDRSGLEVKVIASFLQPACEVRFLAAEVTLVQSFPVPVDSDQRIFPKQRAGVDV